MQAIKNWLTLLNGKITRRFGQDIQAMHPLFPPNLSVSALLIECNHNSKSATPKALSPSSAAKLGQ